MTGGCVPSRMQQDLGFALGCVFVRGARVGGQVEPHHAQAAGGADGVHELIQTQPRFVRPVSNGLGTLSTLNTLLEPLRMAEEAAISPTGPAP